MQSQSRLSYEQMPKYSLERALFQGTLFPQLDDHWRQKEEAFKAQFQYR
ncbi:MAG: hypothetical protein JWN30_2226 [Bacilli bacterium]|nr:hypothetical protein [Bacilli bacterium]